METEDVNYLVWLRNNTKQIEDSEDVVYKGGIVTISELKNIYQNLKITEVAVFGYNNFFTIEIRDETFYSLEESIRYVSEQIVDTASVIRIRQKRWLYDIDIVVTNNRYIPPNKINSQQSEKYLKQQAVLKELGEEKKQVLQIGEDGADVEMHVLKNVSGIYFVHFVLFKRVENVRCLIQSSPIQCFNSADELNNELKSLMTGKKVTI